MQHIVATTTALAAVTTFMSSCMGWVQSPDGAKHSLFKRLRTKFWDRSRCPFLNLCKFLNNEKFVKLQSHGFQVKIMSYNCFLS